MPDPEPVVAPAQATRAGGTLILVVGPSGAGKDTLIDAARGHFQREPSILFWERIITRDDQTGERHTAVSDSEFARLEENGGFFLCWTAHGLHYGIDGDILDALASGLSVIVNVSRRVIPEARAKWPNTHVVQITARPEILSRRLLARGRETAASIGSRLERGQDLRLSTAEWLTEVDNSGDLDSSVARFTALIARLAATASGQ